MVLGPSYGVIRLPDHRCPSLFPYLQPHLFTTHALTIVVPVGRKRYSGQKKQTTSWGCHRHQHQWRKSAPPLNAGTQRSLDSLPVGPKMACLRPMRLSPFLQLLIREFLFLFSPRLLLSNPHWMGLKVFATPFPSIADKEAGRRPVAPVMEEFSFFQALLIQSIDVQTNVWLLSSPLDPTTTVGRRINSGRRFLG